MRLYITGSSRRSDIDELAAQLSANGHTCNTPFDVIDEGITDRQNLRNRCIAAIEAEAVVTTSPSADNWSEGAKREVACARASDGEVLTAVKALDLRVN